MSQYSRPLAVLVGAPVTFVGPLAADFAVGFAVVFLGAVWATDAPASAISVMARIQFFIVSPFFFGVRRVKFVYKKVHAKAITSISTKTSLGNRATSTVERAGGDCLK